MALESLLKILIVAVILLVIIHFVWHPHFTRRCAKYCKDCAHKLASPAKAPEAAPAASFSDAPPNEFDPVTKENFPAPTFRIDSIIPAPTDGSGLNQSSNLESNVPLITPELVDLNRNTDFESFLIENTEVAREGISSTRVHAEDAKYRSTASRTAGDEEIYRMIADRPDAAHRQREDHIKITRAALESRGDVEAPLRTYYHGGITRYKPRPHRSQSGATQVMVAPNADEESGDVDITAAGPIVSAPNGDQVTL
jgi:hypothetical protein